MHTNRYSFTKPYINGEKTKWKQVVDFVVSSGPVTKMKLLLMFGQKNIDIAM